MDDQTRFQDRDCQDALLNGPLKIFNDRGGAG